MSEGRERDPAAVIGQELMEFDIAKINETDIATDSEFDRIVGILALEHFGRFEALLKCIRDETIARNLFLIMSRRTLREANEIQGRINDKSIA